MLNPLDILVHRLYSYLQQTEFWVKGILRKVLLLSGSAFMKVRSSEAMLEVRESKLDTVVCACNARPGETDIGLL